MAKITLPRQKNIETILASLPKTPKEKGKLVNQYSDIPFTAIFKKLTLEELEKCDKEIDYITIVDLCFRYKLKKYFFEISFSPLPPKKHAFHELQLTQKKVGFPSMRDMEEVISRISSYYSVRFKRDFFAIADVENDLVTDALLDTPIIHMKDLIDDIQQFFIPNFKEIQNIKVMFREIPFTKLIKISLPIKKLTLLKYAL